LLPLLPPGVVTFFMYRRSWKRGRILRAHRDVLLLPLRHIHPDGTGSLPDGEAYSVLSCDQREAMRYVAEGAYLPDPPTKLTSREYSVFGSPSADGVTVPADPMTELTVIPGDPTELSLRCQKLARRFEILSILILGGGLLANVAIAFLTLQYLVR
jgi:hypothetical protein